MLPLELAGFWLGAGLDTWDHSLLLLGGRCSATRLLVRYSEAARQSARGGEAVFLVSTLTEGVVSLVGRLLAINSTLLHSWDVHSIHWLLYRPPESIGCGL